MILKKKGLHKLWMSSRTKKLHYSGPNNGKSFTTSAPQFRWGGLFSFLEQKSASKALKTRYFEYFSGQLLFRPMVGATAPRPLATLLLFRLDSSHVNFRLTRRMQYKIERYQGFESPGVKQQRSSIAFHRSTVHLQMGSKEICAEKTIH